MRAVILLTFRELRARKITIGLFLMSTLAWVMLLFAFNLDIVEGSLAGVRIFGNEEGVSDLNFPNSDGMDLLQRFVISIESFVAGAAYWVAALLGLFATAPLFTQFMEAGQSDLIFSKPISRSRILTGHLLGVALTVALLAFYLFFMVWLVMSLKSGIWNLRFFLAIPVVVTMFMVLYSVVTLTTIATRSTALSLIVAYGLIFCSIILVGGDDLAAQITLPWRYVFVGFYHVLPNFAEVTALPAQLTGIDRVETLYPFFSSILFGAAIYAVAYGLLNRKDL